jgi:DNA-directed RNA polymerase subunit alpha
MPRIPFQKPRKVEWEILTERYGRLVAEPFEKGYALTVGHAMRQTLLRVVQGAAVSWVKIDGIRNPETPIPGVVERTQDVLLNLRRLAIQVPSGEPCTVRLELEGPRRVTGADIPETGFEIVNSELHLFTLEAGARVGLELGIDIGRGYQTADTKAGLPPGALPVDSAFSPVTRVAYHVEMSRLGKITDYEKLVLEIWTNGAASPEDALERAAAVLKAHVSPLAIRAPEDEAEGEAPGAEPFLRQALARPLEELPLPARALNALKSADLHLVVDLVQKTEAELEAVKNLGEKSLEEIKSALAALGLSLGMRIDPGVLAALGRGGVLR